MAETSMIRTCLNYVFCHFIEPLYEIVGTTSSRLEDGSSPQIQLLDPFIYFGQPYSQIYVCLLHVYL